MSEFGSNIFDDDDRPTDANTTAEPADQPQSKESGEPAEEAPKKRTRRRKAQSEGTETEEPATDTPAAESPGDGADAEDAEAPKKKVKKKRVRKKKATKSAADSDADDSGAETETAAAEDAPADAPPADAEDATETEEAPAPRKRRSRRSKPDTETQADEDAPAEDLDADRSSDDDDGDRDGDADADGDDDAPTGKKKRRRSRRKRGDRDRDRDRDGGGRDREEREERPRPARRMNSARPGAASNWTTPRSRFPSVPGMRTALLLDADLLVEQAKDLDGEIAFSKIESALAGRRSMIRRVAYGTPAVDETLDGPLRAAGFEIRKAADRAQLAVAIAVDAMAIGPRVDCIVIAPGSVELTALTGALRSSGIRVESAGFGEEPANADLDVEGHSQLGNECMFTP